MTSLRLPENLMIWQEWTNEQFNINLGEDYVILLCFMIMGKKMFIGHPIEPEHEVRIR